MAMVGGDSGTMLVGGWPAVGGAVVGFNAADSACDDGNGDDAASGDCADMRRIVAVQVLKVHARCQVTVCCLCLRCGTAVKLSAGSVLHQFNQLSLVRRQRLEPRDSPL